MSALARGKTVVITGASRGLGAGMAEELARLGARLGLCSRGDPALPSGDDVVAARVDVRDAEAMDAFAASVAERLGPVDLWINNAGVLEPCVFVRDLTPEALRDHLEINLIGVLNGTRAYLAHARPPGGGVLINVSSGAALHGYAAWGPYCAGKAAVDRLTECVQLEEEPSGLRAHAVAPGVVDTDMQRTIRGLTKDEFPSVEKFHQLKRDEAFNSPAYVARQLAALAFDPSTRIGSVVCRIPPEREAGEAGPSSRAPARGPQE